MPFPHPQPLPPVTDRLLAAHLDTARAVASGRLVDVPAGEALVHALPAMLEELVARRAHAAGVAAQASAMAHAAGGNVVALRRPGAAAAAPAGGAAGADDAA